MLGGNNKLIEIIKEDLKDVSLDVRINIAGKQKDLSGITDKLVNVLRFMLQTYDPNTKTFAVFNDPRMLKLFENIIEYSGLSPIDFYMSPEKIMPQMIQQPVQKVPVGAGEVLENINK
jgi:hypothetical protein